VLPLVPVDSDCCLSLQEKEQLSEISLNKPLTNILSSVEDLKIASFKIDEIQKMIQEEKKKFEHFSLSLTTSGSVITIVTFIVPAVLVKCCRQIGFWIWDKWTPKQCIRQTRERCCVVNNFSADRIHYSEVRPSPLQVESLDTPPGTPIPSRSLPVSLLAPNPSKFMIPEATRRRPYKLMEDLELSYLKVKPKNKERKDER
jgi:hypothetical protein